MQTATHIFHATPLWAFALLAYLIWQGMQSLRTRTVPVWRALLVPGLFIAMGLSRIVLNHETGTVPYLSWLGGAVLVAPLALVTGPRLLAVDRVKGQVTRPGSPVSLIRNVTVFCLQYGVATATAMKLNWHETVVLIGHAVSGAEAGYFFAWATLLLNRYGKARKAAILA
jgi:hypothetical protein